MEESRAPRKLNARAAVSLHGMAKWAEQTGECLGAAGPSSLMVHIQLSWSPCLGCGHAHRAFCLPILVQVVDVSSTINEACATLLEAQRGEPWPPVIDKGHYMSRWEFWFQLSHWLCMALEKFLPLLNFLICAMRKWDWLMLEGSPTSSTLASMRRCSLIWTMKYWDH